MQNKLIFISFYSKNTVYEKIINARLLPSLKRLNLPYWIKSIENRGSWSRNACQKPAIILEAMNRFQEDIIWIDADAEIKEFPSLLYKIPEKYNIGIHYLSWKEHYGRPSDKGKFELIDGTIYIRNNQKMRLFILKWKQISTDKEINHQRILAEMIIERTDIKVFDFGRKYCYITLTPGNKKPAIELENPIILHYQASRIAKKNLREE